MITRLSQLAEKSYMNKPPLTLICSFNSSDGRFLFLCLSVLFGL